MMNPIAIVVAAASLAACRGGDVVLGEVGGRLAVPVAVAGEGAGEGAIAGISGTAGAAGNAEVPGGKVGVAAGSGSAGAGSGGVGGSASDPGPPARDADVDAAPPSVVARPSAGCGKDPALADPSVDLDATRSNYSVELPKPYDRTRAYPLILAFRGTDTTADEFRTQLDLSSVTGADAIAVYPNPLTETAAWEFTRDMPLFDVLLPKIKSDYCIDEDRVFALGNGAGSLFVNLVGCVRADAVRAIAPLTGAPPPPGPCMGYAAVWLAQGAGDPMTVGASRGNRDFWVSRNACNVRTQIPVAPASCLESANCKPGFPVRYCEHSESGLPSFAASGAWDFFRSL